VFVAAAARPALGSSPLGLVGQVLWAPVRYVGGRVADLAEAVDLNVGIGDGAKVDVRYGVNFLGAGRVRAVRAGLHGGRLALWKEKDHTLGLFPLSLLGWPAHLVGRVANSRKLRDQALELATAHALGTQTVERDVVMRQAGTMLGDAVKSWRHTRWGDSLPIGGEVHAALVGARLVAKPLQLLDFAVGFAGIDLDPWLAKKPF
jgi:hypothetical protein